MYTGWTVLVLCVWGGWFQFARGTKFTSLTATQHLISALIQLVFHFLLPPFILPPPSLPPSSFPPFSFPPSYPQQTDATATAIEHILGKTKEVLQPNPSKLESHSQNTVKIQVWPGNETVPHALQKKHQIHDVVFFLLYLTLFDCILVSSATYM